MITLLHGDDIVSSRNKLLEEKSSNKNEEVRTIDGAKIAPKDLFEMLSAQTLFAIPQTFVIENLLSGSKSKAKDENITIAIKAGETHSIILWEKNEIGKANLTKYFSKAKVYAFAHPRLLFTFLDSIGRYDTHQLLSTFHQLTKQTDAEMVYAMLVRQWRYLIIAKDARLGPSSGLSPWQAKKFESQAKYFSHEQLIKSYRNLLSIDASIKFGRTPLQTSALLDIFLMNL